MVVPRISKYADPIKSKIGIQSVRARSNAFIQSLVSVMLMILILRKPSSSPRTYPFTLTHVDAPLLYENMQRNQTVTEFSFLLQQRLLIVK